MEEGQFETAPQFTPVPVKKKINKRFIYLVGIVVFLIIAFLGYKILGFSKPNTLPQVPVGLTPTIEQVATDTPVPTQMAEETPTPEPTDTPTPKPTSNPLDSATGLDRSKLTVTVENGSGEAGVASSGKEFLAGFGYDVTDTSNADNFDYVNVTIKIKKSAQDYLSLLKKDLNTKYTVGDTSSDLEDSNSSDALVIIGK
jgi:hypothetical protein